MKLLPFKTIGTTANFDFDEVYTVLCQVEAISNSRPFTVVSDDDKDSHLLNPAMLSTSFRNHQLSLIVPRVQKTKDGEMEENQKKWTNKYLS